MYCGECGAKIGKNEAFCGECGAKVIQEESPNESTSSQNAQKQVNRQPMSKKKKILLLVCAVLVVGLYLGYNHLSEKYGPKGVAEGYVKALMAKDADKLYDYLNLEGDKTFTSKGKFKEIIKDSDDSSEITNYVIGNVNYSDGNLSAQVGVKYTLKGAQTESTETVHLTKSKKKALGIFATWEISEDFDSILVKDYKIKVPKNSKVTVDKVTLDKKYLDSKSSSDNWDVYKIPQIFQSSITIKANISGFDVEQKVTPSTYYNDYTMELSLKNLSKENVSSLEEQIKTDYNTLYKNLIEKKTWDQVKESYNFKGANLTELEEIYKDLYDDIVDNDYRTLKAFNITSVSVSTLSLTDEGQIRVGFKANYDYTVDYKKYDDSIETKNGKSSSNTTFYYVYSEDALKLVDGYYLVSYFSTY